MCKHQFCDICEGVGTSLAEGEVELLSYYKFKSNETNSHCSAKEKLQSTERNELQWVSLKSLKPGRFQVSKAYDLSKKKHMNFHFIQ